MTISSGPVGPHYIMAMSSGPVGPHSIMAISSGPVGPHYIMAISAPLSPMPLRCISALGALEKLLYCTTGPYSTAIFNVWD